MAFQDAAGGVMLGWLTHDLAADEAELGKPFAMVRVFQSEFDLPRPDDPEEDVPGLMEAGKLVLFSVKPPVDPALDRRSWSMVGSGAADAKLDEIVAGLKQLSAGHGQQLVLIFGHEPHDNCGDITARPGSEKDFGTAAEFVAAFQHVSKRIRGDREADPDVKVGYCATGTEAVKGRPAGPGDPCYPGKDFVDLLCHDSYNYYRYQTRDDGSFPPWRSFEEKMEKLLTVARHQNKRLIIAETGCHPGQDGYSRDQWFQDAASWLTGRPDTTALLIGFCYFHKVHEHDWEFVNVNDGEAGYREAFVVDSKWNGGNAAWFTSTPIPL
ncbi:MAG: hypothetical protein ACRD0C_07350 [Acidimicrobiia bacterium]